MTTAEAAMAVVSFEQQMKHARELVDEGHRLLHTAERDLKAGRTLVRQTQQMLMSARRERGARA